MARIQDTQTFTITHPKLKDVKVICRELDPIEAMDMFSGLAKYQKVVAILHPVTGEIVRDGDEIATSIRTNLPSEAILKILETNLEGWEGIEDSKGNPIPFNSNNIRHLFNRAFSLVKMVEEKDGDKVTMKPTPQSFADYIQQEINARIDKQMKELNEELGSPKSKG